MAFHPTTSRTGVGVLSATQASSRVLSGEDFAQVVVERQRHSDVAMLVLAQGGGTGTCARVSDLEERAAPLLAQLDRSHPAGWLPDGRLCVLLQPTGAGGWDLGLLVQEAHLSESLLGSGLLASLEIRPRRPSSGAKPANGAWSMPRTW